MLQNLPYQTIHLLLVVIFVHLIDIQLDVSFFVKGMFFEVDRLHVTSHIEPLGTKMISARYIGYNALSSFLV